MMYHTKLDEDYICANLMADRTQIPKDLRNCGYKQLSLFDTDTLCDLAIPQTTVIQSEAVS